MRVFNVIEAGKTDNIMFEIRASVQTATILYVDACFIYPKMSDGVITIRGYRANPIIIK
jgi:hypothetical protein